MVKMTLFAWALFKAFVRGVIIYYAGRCIVTGTRSRVRFSVITIGMVYQDYKKGHEPYFFMFSPNSIRSELICRRVVLSKGAFTKAM